MDAFTQTLQSWQTFYFTAGGASATLIGLMFVALSLAQSLITNVTMESFKAFASPTIFHFGSVLFIAFAMLVPAFSPAGLGIVLVISGVGGSVVSGHYVSKLARIALQQGDFNLGDWLAQVILPTTSYLLILAAGVGFLAEQANLAFAGVCLAVLGLFACGIANTWSMVVWVVEKRTKT